tara:strand:- start:1810 stop:1977 length:168 start_codon:yes stop_codon:yes gene_type:complete
MRSDKSYRSAAIGSFFGILGIIIVCLVMIIMSLIPGCEKINKKNTPITNTDIIEK